MVISEKRHRELYDSISNPIMDLRIKQSGGMTIEEMDKCLFALETAIYKRVAKALDLYKG